MFIAKKCWGTLVPDEVCASETWSFSSGCKNLRGQHRRETEIWFSEKVDLGGSKCTSKTLLLAGQSSLDFFAELGRNCCLSHVLLILDISTRSGDNSDQTLKSSKIAPNFAHFWPPNFFSGEPPNFTTGIIQEIWANARETRDSISLISYACSLGLSPVISATFHPLNMRRSQKSGKIH